MAKNIIILLISGLVIALPFLFRQAPQVTDWHEGDPELVVITPHNEAIRFEFAQGFSHWHQQHYGKPKIDWRAGRRYDGDHAVSGRRCSVSLYR